MIWYVDIYDHQKFEERNYHIPKIFLEFFDYTNSESYKQLRKNFNTNELNLHYQAFALYATSSWILIANFDWLRNAFDSFIVAILNYIRFL